MSYLGNQPLDGQGVSVDVLVTRKSTVECRWYFRSSDGVLAGFDSSLGTDVDAAQIRFLDFQDVQGRYFPSRFAVQYGNTDYGTFEVTTVDISAANETAN